MTLNQAIAHATRVSKREGSNSQCQCEHARLAKWLRELKSYRKLASHNLTKIVQESA